LLNQPGFVFLDTVAPTPLKRYEYQLKLVLTINNDLNPGGVLSTLTQQGFTTIRLD